MEAANLVSVQIYHRLQFYIVNLVAVTKQHLIQLHFYNSQEFNKVKRNESSNANGLCVYKTNHMF